MTSSNRLYLFDTTLRDGAQTQGVDFTVADKAAIARELDLLGIDYIEGGWPGANPTDDRFFADPPEFRNAKFVAFGMTRRAGRSAANDPGLAALLQTKARNVVQLARELIEKHEGQVPRDREALAARCATRPRAAWSKYGNRRQTNRSFGVRSSTMPVTQWPKRA